MAIVDTLEYFLFCEYFNPQTLNKDKQQAKEEMQYISFDIKSTDGVDDINLNILNKLTSLCKSKYFDNYNLKISVFGGIFLVSNIKDEILKLENIKEKLPNPNKNLDKSAAFLLEFSGDLKLEDKFGNLSSYKSHKDKKSFDEKIPVIESISHEDLEDDIKFSFKEFNFSTTPWALNNYNNLKNINYSQFTNLVYITKEQITALNSNINKTLSFGNFIKLALEKIKNSGLWNEILSDDLKIIIELHKNKSSSTLLNSFFIKDILKTLELYRNKNSCKTIDSYLFEGENINKFDVLASQNISKIFDSFDMDYFPNGAWPSKFPLMFSQQFAINEILKRFKSTDTIYSINGPPGTGKTTLLKDLIAAIITQRAQILANLQSNEIFTAIKDEKDMLKFYDLNDELKGYEIVVASSNNSAVENISLEIPGLDEVDKDCLCEFDYFKELSDRLINKPCWGLISVKLGKLANKSSFVYDFLRNSLQKATKPTEFSDDMIKIEIENAEEKYHLLGFSNYLKKTNFMSFEEAKAEFKIALNKVLDIKQNIKSKKQILDDYPNRIKEIDNELSKLSQKYNGELNFDLLINKNNQKIDRLQNQIDNLKIIQNSLIDDKKFYINSKPFLYFVHKFFNTQMYKKFIKQYEILNEKINGICTEISLAQKELLDCECLAENTEFDTDKFKKLQAQKIEFSDDYNEAKSYFEIHFLQDQETRQKSSPFMKENGVKKSEFFKARTALFLKALKLHKAAIYENKDKICKNFNLIDKMFSYNADFESSFNPKEKLLLWQNLFFVTPVVSSTFSAFSTCFSSFDMSDIGYLLIDEAGQATIPSGVGALLRSKRVAILGDPLQIEPVVTLGNDLNEIFLTKMGVKEEFNLAQTSIQKRGDKIEINGTSIKQAAVKFG
ncbi:hypothetical protein CFT12S02855_02475 [Campylobacter fetus subsp. testudinum]|uniref:AAA domain-containing protein n=1 Tax=Campylobacter fetus TaxID=196 RepID=UPI000818A9FF|nr:AAA domain-containing protein [Campylobacter fetus]OCR98414.1 hypothetical protein CFT12S02855_02475 [Campylobacter fetus subsp. testudinum]